MLYLLIIIGFFISVCLSGLIIPHISFIAFRKRLFDPPNERKIHTGTIPRLGGISFLPIIFFSSIFILSLRYKCGYPIPLETASFLVPEFSLLICGLILIYLAGIKDDLTGLNYRTKFLIQILVASFLPLSGLWINNLYGLFGIEAIPSWLGISFTILTVVFIINAINLIDGIDGLAAGISSLSLILLGSLFLYEHAWLYACLAFSTLGVLLPFFYYNVFGRVECSKKIFMGDTGSQTLGYILAFLSIRYISHNPHIMPYKDEAFVLAFSTLIVPIFDVFRVMSIRVRTHQHLFSPDRNHIHHKFLERGFKPREVLVYILGLVCLFCCLNILLVPYVSNTWILLIDIGIWIAISLALDRIKVKEYNLFFPRKRAQSTFKK